MEDSREETPPDKPISIPAPPASADVEPQPDDNVQAPKFFFSANSATFKKEDIE